MAKGGQGRARAPRRQQPQQGGAGGSGSSWVQLVPLVLCVVVVSFGYVSLVRTLFENDRFFSALTETERELSFRSEQALYYSYYKDLVETFDRDGLTPTGLAKAFQGLTRNRDTEYPDTINVVRRMNIYPEIVLATWYRVWLSVSRAMGRKKLKECYQLQDETTSEALVTCSGPAVPSYFYVDSIFEMQGVLSGALFLLCWYISGKSIAGGLFGILVMLSNHGEFSRVMWTPPLRESFAFPCFVCQLLTVIVALRAPPTRRHVFAIAATTFAFALPWQFAQFALFTQVTSIFAIYLLDYVPSTTLLRIFLAEAVAMVAVLVLQFGNLFLLCSFFFAFLMATVATVSMEAAFLKLDGVSRWLRRIGMGLVSVVLTGVIKIGLGLALGVRDDDHIFHILWSKFDESHINFHAKLYTCAPEFDFMSKEYWEMSKTLMLPLAVVVVVGIVGKMIADELGWKKPTAPDSKPEQGSSLKPATASALKPNGELAYIFFQFCWFLLLAALIMRLKLFFTLAQVMACSLVLSPTLFGFYFGARQSIKFAVVALIASAMAAQSIGPFLTVLNKEGQFNDAHLLEVVKFVEKETPPTASFAGTMPMTSVIRCSGRRAIVNHPHYEDVGIRNRTFEVYKIFARFDDQEVFDMLSGLSVDYVLLDPNWCSMNRRAGCNMLELYDHAYPERKAAGTKTFCSKWLGSKKGSPLFNPVLVNARFTLLQVRRAG